MGEFGIELHDARPVGFLRSMRSRVAGSDLSLHDVRTTLTAEFRGRLECGETSTNEQLIPSRPVLIEKQDEFSRWTDSRT